MKARKCVMCSRILKKRRTEASSTFAERRTCSRSCGFASTHGRHPWRIFLVKTMRTRRADAVSRYIEAHGTKGS